jgi:hypothetical protein
LAAFGVIISQRTQAEACALAHRERYYKSSPKLYDSGLLPLLTALTIPQAILGPNMPHPIHGMLNTNPKIYSRGIND